MKTCIIIMHLVDMKHDFLESTNAPEILWESLLSTNKG